MRELDDMELVKHAQAGNMTAVAELYDRHQPRIFRYIRFKVANTHAAQDLTGEVFLRMVDNLPGFRPMEVPFSAWLYRIAHNLVTKQGQKEALQPMVALAHADNMNRNHDNPAYVVEKQLEMEWVLQGLDNIDESQREVIILRFVAGFSLQEVAEMLDKSLGAVKTLQHRGILALQVALAYE